LTARSVDFPSIRWRAGQRFQQQAAERGDVCAPRGCATVELGDPETAEKGVGGVTVITVANQHVRGRDIAMDEPPPMCGG
jgi:hypothetical protein